MLLAAGQGSTCPGDVEEPMEGCRVRSRHGSDPVHWEERPYHGGMSHLPGLPVLPSPHVTSERTPGRWRAERARSQRS